MFVSVVYNIKANEVRREKWSATFDSCCLSSKEETNPTFRHWCLEGVLLAKVSALEKSAV
jgi:hypothetical protein